MGKDKGSHGSAAGSAATGEREGSGNLKVKMQIRQPGDGDPGREEERGGESAVREGRETVRKRALGKGLEAVASEDQSGASIPAPPLFAKSRGGRKRHTHSWPLLSSEQEPIPRVSPGLRGAGGCRVRLAEAQRVGDFIAMGR